MRIFRLRKTEKTKGETKEAPTLENTLASIRIDRSFALQDIDKTRSKLRLAGTEKEILSEILARIYEVAADGKITQIERDQLVSKYQKQLSAIMSTYEQSEKLLNLHELEETRAELIKMFQDKFKELNVKIDELRKKVEAKPGQSIAIKLPTLIPAAEEKTLESKNTITEDATPPTPAAVPTTSTIPRRIKADDALEKLRKDLQKELEKLEQIEMEA